ncbi:cytochrome P450 [Altererythrobacter atlanticus]|uniref:Cytochrome P450 130 n=1 Tax=Croceibacterium atlanticum TaxID=1267766 RepID=A0A0F7KS59_9SPHN|nr:cytochrome P450 [Croceibacterium atlanticum]AKH41956.1 Cytochrome P450 130 [Croceibacterium atlanticum]MBB5733476.1 cytochrome P450 [Croceibacterium atlanticum]
MTEDNPNLPDRPEDFDAEAPETFESPHQLYRHLRAECPVAHSNAYGGFWALTRYQDIVDAVTDNETFITSKINVIPNMSMGKRRPPLGKDPPEHTPFRRALDKTLRNARIQALEPVLRAHAVREMSRIVADGVTDISLDFATIFPAWVAVEWLNLDETHAPLLAEVARLYNVAWRAEDTEAVVRTSEKLYDIAASVVKDRKANPRSPETDPASALLAERTEFGPIPEEYVIATVRQVLVVGLMAPPPLFGSMCVHLASDPELQQLLRDEPQRIPAAIEELLRLYSPYRGFARTTTRDYERHGRTIPAGEPVTMVYSSANRDERVFDDPDSFRFDRENIRSHLAFGRGVHQCAGSGLVRLELRIFLEELLSRTSEIHLNGEIEMARMPELGPAATPLRLVPAR